MGTQNTDVLAEYCWACQSASGSKFTMNDHSYVHGADCEVKMDGSTIYLEEWVDTHEED